jgi:ribonuclease P protein component
MTPANTQGGCGGEARDAAVDLRFGRSVRLSRRADFRRARERGRSWADRLLVLNALPNGLPHSRFGLVVSKRVGKAVQRNRVRRLMREAVRLERPNVAPGWDLVWIARSGMAGADWEAIRQSVCTLLQWAGLIAGL